MSLRHGQRTLRFVVLITLLGIPSAASPQVTEPGKSLPAGDAADDDECTGAAPEAILLPGTYKDQKFKRGKDNQATESALIDSKTRMEISYSGCMDGLGQKITLSVRSEPGKDGDIGYWAGFVRQKLASLRVDPKKAWFLPPIVEFLSKASKYKPHHHKVHVCRDGSAPDDDDCGFKTGGGYFFELERHGGTLRVIAGQYQSL
ncbi:MAG TPA: hypothetical protein VF173_33540 [Thermoanaerobaculia bacterium]|nr:hypothetical protein [Thermoanaerobaculia bacterium]